MLDLELVVALYRRLSRLRPGRRSRSACFEYLDRVEPWLSEGGLRRPPRACGPTLRAEGSGRPTAGRRLPVPGRGRPRGTGQLTASSRFGGAPGRVARWTATPGRPGRARVAAGHGDPLPLQRFLHDHGLGSPLGGWPGGGRVDGAFLAPCRGLLRIRLRCLACGSERQWGHAHDHHPHTRGRRGEHQVLAVMPRPARPGLVPRRPACRAAATATATPTRPGPGRDRRRWSPVSGDAPEAEA